MSEFTRKELSSLKKDVKVFDSVGLGWLAKISKREYDILNEKIQNKRIN